MKAWIARKDISTPRKVWSIVLLIAAGSFFLIGLSFLPAMLFFGPLSLACFVGAWHVGRGRS